MFEVNGIDDFYDKNAMITYEINGHEIPVHMKPHFTPQTKSLFPEYAKDSPKEMAGFVRGGGGGKGSRSGGKMHGYIKQINSVRFHPAGVAGLTINDMPEYKMQRFTGKTSDNMWKSLEGMKEDRVSGVINNGFKQNQALQRMFQKQLPVISALKKIQQQHIRKNDAKYEGVADQSLKYHVPRYQTYPSSKPLQSINKEFVNNRQPTGNKNNNLNDRNPKLLQQFMASRSAQSETLTRSETSKGVDDYDHFTPNYNGKSAFMTQQKSSVSSQMEQQQQKQHIEDEENAHFKTGIAQRPSANAVSADRYKVHEDIQASTLFKNLDSLHKKLQIDKQINQEEQLQSKHQQHQDPHKAQAKTRILNLLGELTEKLKGMESIVTKHQNKAIAEKFMANHNSNEIEGHSRVEDETMGNTNTDDEAHGASEVPSLSANTEPAAEVEAMNQLGAQLTEKVSSLQHGLDEGLRNADSRSYKDDSTTPTNEARIAVDTNRRVGEGMKNNKAFLADSFMKIDENPSYNDDEVNSEETANHRVENKEMVDSLNSNNNKQAIIQSFHNPNNNHENVGGEPIIMDTKAIDYKPMDDGQDTSDDDNNNNLLNSYGEEDIHVQDSLKHRKKFVGKEDDDDDDDDSDENADPNTDISEQNSSSTLKKHWKKPEVDEDPIPSRQTLMKYHHNNMKDSEDSEQTSSLTDNDMYNGVDSLTQINKKKAATRRHKPHHAHSNHHIRHHKQQQFIDNNKDSQEEDSQNNDDDEERDEDESIKAITLSNLRKHHHHKRHHKQLDYNDLDASPSSISPADGDDGKAIAEEQQDAGDAAIEEPTTLHHHHNRASMIEDNRNLLGEKSIPTTTGTEDSGERENSKMFEVEESLGDAEEKNNIARHRSFKPKSLGKLIPHKML